MWRGGARAVPLRSPVPALLGLCRATEVDNKWTMASLLVADSYRCPVDLVQAGLWGLAGGFVVDGLEFYTAVRRYGCLPWKVKGPGLEAGRVAYLIAESVRMLVGGILASGAASSGQVSGPLAAIAIGVAAPLMVERLTALIPLSQASGAHQLPVSPVTFSQNDKPGHVEGQTDLPQLPNAVTADHSGQTVGEVAE